MEPIKRGDKFGQLIALKIKKMTRWNEPVWSCRCSCKQNYQVSYHENLLKNGIYARCRMCDKIYYDACGIPRSDYQNSCSVGEKGHAVSSLYKIWQSMAYRCFTSNPVVSRYFKHIPEILCESWKKFENFYEDMSPKPEGTRLHRINSLKGFYPDNCTWKTCISDEFGIEEDFLSFDEQPVQVKIEDALEINSYDAPATISMDSYLEDLEKTIEQEELAVLNSLSEIRKKYEHVEAARKALKNVMSFK